jgi:predicted transcriptional regulator
MGKTQLNVRLPEDILEALDKRANKTGESKTDIVSKALASHLGIGSTEPDISNIVKRLERLETKFQQGTPPPTAPITTDDRGLADPDDFGDLITKQEAEQITGYKVKTFSRSFSQAEPKIMSQGKRGQQGLYSKSDILTKIGIK